MLYCGTYCIEFSKGKSVMPRGLAVSDDMEWCLLKEKGKDDAMLPKLLIRAEMTDDEKKLLTENFAKQGDEVIKFGKVKMMRNRFFVLPTEFIACCNAENIDVLKITAIGVISFIEIYKESDFEKRLNFRLDDFLFVPKEGADESLNAKLKEKEEFDYSSAIKNCVPKYEIHDATEADELIETKEESLKSIELLEKAIEYFKDDKED